MAEIDPKTMNPIGRPLTIVFALPGDTFSNKFVMSWTLLFNYCVTHQINPLITNHAHKNSYYVRNLCLGGNNLKGVEQKPFNGEVDYDYVMWIDANQVFNVDSFLKLLVRDIDVVSGMYLMENTKEFAVVKEWSKSHFEKHGGFEFLSTEEVSLMIKKEQEPLLDVEYTGMGWMLVKKGVFEKMEYPWFRPEMTTMNITDPSGNEIKVKEFTTEDVFFCRKVKELGFKVLVDTSVIVGNEVKLVL